MPRLDDLAASVQGIQGYMQAVREGKTAQADQLFNDTLQTLKGLQTAATTRESLSLTMARDELLPFKKRQAATQAETGEIGLGQLKTTLTYLQGQLGKETTPEGIKLLSDSIANLVNVQQSQTELERGVGRARGVAAGAAAGAELAEAGERTARARTGIVTEPGRRERVREEDVLAATTARAETRIVQPVTAAKKAEAEARVPVAELAGERARQLQDAGLPEAEARIASVLLEKQPELMDANIAALSARAAGKDDAVLQQMLGDNYPQFKLLGAKLDMAGPLIANIRQAETALKAMASKEFDLINLFILEKRGFDFDVTNIEEDEKKQEAAKKGLQDFIKVQKALLKSPLLDIDYDELARQSILTPKQKAAMAEQLRQRRQGGATTGTLE